MIDAQTLAKFLERICPEEGAMNGELHPRWEDACRFAAETIAGDAEAYRPNARHEGMSPAVQKESYARLIINEGRRLRNEYLSAV
jgi:hypothetical protein